MVKNGSHCAPLFGTASKKKLGALKYVIVPVEMAQKLDFSQCTLGQNRFLEDLCDALDGDFISIIKALCRAEQV